MSELQRVVELANLLVKERMNVASLKVDLEDAERNVRRLEQEDIPRWRVSLLWLAVRFYAIFVWKPKYGWANRKRVN